MYLSIVSMVLRSIVTVLNALDFVSCISRSRDFCPLNGHLSQVQRSPWPRSVSIAYTHVPSWISLGHVSIFIHLYLVLKRGLSRPYHQEHNSGQSIQIYWRLWSALPTIDITIRNAHYSRLKQRPKNHKILILSKGGVPDTRYDIWSPT